MDDVEAAASPFDEEANKHETAFWAPDSLFWADCRSFNPSSSITTGLISFIYNIKAFNGFLMCGLNEVDEEDVKSTSLTKSPVFSLLLAISVGSLIMATLVDSGAFVIRHRGQ
uniref:Uncharacterized protein n=1 Tax=Romanomermis culicivorax TaxID=13658 RepID=A0A915J6V8_ROMCU